MKSTFIINQFQHLPVVSAVSELKPGLLEVERRRKRPIMVGVSDERYIEIDNVAQALERWPDIDALVVVGKDRHVSGNARRYGQENNVAVMVLRDLLGALLYADEGEWASYEQAWKTFAREALIQHPKVRSVEYECESLLLVKRPLLGDVRVVPVDIYTLGSADVLKIRTEHPELDAILNASKFRSITSDAVERGKELGVGIFNLSGMYKALYRNRANFVRIHD
jgi:hypothetical protein